MVQLSHYKKVDLSKAKTIMRKEVLLVQPIHQSGISLLEQEVQVIQATDTSAETVRREIKGVHGAIVRTAPLTREIIESSDKLRVIARHGVGVDDIDLQTATKRKIVVLNTPEANMGSVAEHALGFMLGLAKRLIVNDKATRKGEFAIREEFSTIDLERKVLGIIGSGRTGSALNTKCRAAFAMRVLAYDPYLSDEKLRESGAEPCNSLDELLSQADFVSIHVPLTAETLGMIGERQLKIMKQSAFLINMARGGIVEESTLEKALQNKWIAGAATDVFDTEPPPTDHPLLKLKNIILSLHLAALTQECTVRMAVEAAVGVLDVLKGKVPKNVVNKDLLVE
jgi:D-3-phosphoglycerate dehydrogenase